MPERRQSFCITKTHVFVANVARNSRRHCLHIHQSGLRRFVEDFKYAFACRTSGLYKLIELMQPADWIVKKCGQHKKSDQIADLHCAHQNGVAAKPQHQYRSDRLKHRHRRRVNGPGSHHHQRGAPQLIAHPIETRMFLALARETFDLANAGKIIVQQRVDVRRSATLQSITPMRG